MCFSFVGWFKLQSIDNLLIPKEIKSFNRSNIFKSIVNRSNFPPFYFKWPFIMLSYIDMIELFNLSSKYNIELFWCFTGITNILPFKIKLWFE